MNNAEEYLQHILKLLRDSKVPDLPGEYAEDPLMVQIHEELQTIREILKEKEETFTDINKRLCKEVEHVETLKESNARFKFLASHDPLTGILNRRAFIEMAEIELATAAYLRIPCCLAMMDIDYFKRFNDTYGHLAGDEALRHAVKIVEANLRKNDFMGRYGGEEFILFFYDSDKETGLKVLERLRANLSESPVSLMNGPVEIHASFGLTEIEAEKSAGKGYVQKLIHDADKALYAAKLAGRNRVVLFSPEMESGGNSIQLFQEGTKNGKEEKAS
jgi:diguanylate cyclase (GGDEF)-like protein